MTRGGGYNVSVTKSLSLDGVGPGKTHWGILEKDDYDKKLDVKIGIKRHDDLMYILRISEKIGIFIAFIF